MLVEKLINWLREEQVKVQQGVFDAPPKSMEDLQIRLATCKTFEDVLTKIDRMQRQGEEDERKS